MRLHVLLSRLMSIPGQHSWSGTLQIRCVESPDPLRAYRWEHTTLLLMLAALVPAGVVNVDCPT